MIKRKLHLAGGEDGSFDYRGEFERLLAVVEQAVAAGFQSAAANGVLESAVKLYDRKAEVRQRAGTTLRE